MGDNFAYEKWAYYPHMTNPAVNTTWAQPYGSQPFQLSNPLTKVDYPVKKQFQTPDLSLSVPQVQFNQSQNPMMKDYSADMLDRTDGLLTGQSKVQAEAKDAQLAKQAKLQKMGKWSQAAGAAFDVTKSFGKQPKDETVNTLNQVNDKMADAALQSGNPYAMMAGAAVKGMSAINRMTGNGGVDGMTGFDKFAASDFGFILGGMSPDPVSQILYWTNRTTAKSTDKFEKDAELEAAQGDAYADSYDDINAAVKHAGKKYGGLSRKSYNKWQNQINIQKQTEQHIANINAENEMAQAAGRYEGVGLANQSTLNGGTSMLRAGKQGMKINNIDWAKSLLLKACLPDLDVVEKFADGGSLEVAVEEFIEEIVPFDLDSLLQKDGDAQYMKEGGTFNVIPEGALHKNLHNMEDAEGLTKKGIPVVTEEDGKYVQQAEIEAREVILRLEVTKKLEELKERSEKSESQKEKDDCAIEAGKLLTQELLHNTKDPTKLIKEC